MKITIVGGHGSIAMLLHPALRERGHEVRGIIRKEEQADDLRVAGAEPVVCDIEQTADISDAVGQADAVLFAAGAGPGSGAERKWTVDRDGAIKLIEAAKKNGIGRYVMISAMGTDRPRGNEVFRTYLKAKEEADEALRNSGLDYTIIKPGRLTDDPGSGRVSLGRQLERGEIPRADVAAVLAEVLEMPETAGLQLDLVSGEQPIPEAVRAVANMG
ncbi:SDR family oxidoreductase [Halalkalibaculum sp. DA3122]|uniref:SDR family oxidoreductase n=1 Tax=Halalkalibaculum sp. DA3122 TaxID=3373607 RepID=UPI0037541021